MAGNLALDSNWDIIIGKGATRIGGVDFVAQNVKSRLLTLLGEWQNDKTLGLAWFDGLLSKQARPVDVQVAVANVISTTNHVRAVNYVTVVPDYSTRKVTLNFSAESTYGTFESSIVYG